MTITTRDDDTYADARDDGITVHDDDLGANLMGITTVANGGTGRAKNGDGPGVVTQQSLGANLTTLPLLMGELLSAGVGGVPQAISRNNTTAIKFLMERALTPDEPFPVWRALLVTDLSGPGTLGVSLGGTGVNAIATGPGLLFQTSLGSVFVVTNAPTIEGLTLDAGAAAGSTLNVYADASQVARVRLKYRGAEHFWDMKHTLQGGGALGFWDLYNSDLGTSAIHVALTNAVTLASLTAASGLTMSPRNINTLMSPARASTDGTDATPVATEFYFAEVMVPVNLDTTGVSVFNGSVASGNMKVALFDSAGVLIASSPSTAMSGTDVYQRVPWGAPVPIIGPASGFIGVFFDNNTARFNTHTVGAGATGKKTAQVYATGFTNITVPTTFTTGLGPIASLY